MIWLAAGCVMVLAMVVIGGITRLTHSGLSMTDWNLIMGAVPPATDEAWVKEFEKYQTSPEFKEVNFHFTVEEFKSIFWWEYIHRLLGRLVGIVFLIPFIVFWLRGYFSKAMIRKLLVVFVLGGLQGFLGWFMVKSGLVKDPAVSHYRLAIHLCAALLIVSYIFWLMLGILFPKRNDAAANTEPLKKTTMGFLLLVTLQIIYGAFVAGLKAGLIHNTFPKMDGEWVSSVIPIMYEDMGIMSLFESHSTVQFIHRILAYAVVLWGVMLWIRSRKTVKGTHAGKGYAFLGTWVIVQATLGVITLLYRVPVSLGVIHQLGAVVLLLTTVYCLYFTAKKEFNGEILIPVEKH